MFGQLHDRRQRHPLAAGLGHEPRPQAVPTKIPLQPGQACPSLHDLAHRGRGQGRADALFPQPPENRPLGDAGRLQPVLQGEGGPIQHRLVRGRAGRNPGLQGLAVLQPVDIARLADPAQVAQIGRGDLAAPAPTAGKSEAVQGAVPDPFQTVIAGGQTATRWRTVAKVHGPSLALRPAATKAWSTTGGSSQVNSPSVERRCTWSTTNCSTVASGTGKASSMP